MNGNDAKIVAFIDDDEQLRAATVQALQIAGYEVWAFSSANDALRRLDADFPGVVVTDIRMPAMDGHQLYQRLVRIDPELPVILITGHGDITEAVQAMQDGAHDFLAKPYAPDRLMQTLSRAVAKRQLVLADRRLKAAAAESEGRGPLIGISPAMERLRETVRQIAEADVDVLIEGETGVGKGLIARTLHAWSVRHRHPFVTVNCAALPENLIESELFGHELGAFNGAMRKRVGRIESADRGSLFLDEVDSMPLSAQGKLLRVLEDREVTPLGTNEVRCVSLRVFAASKLDLGSQAEAGVFRADLFYRLNPIRLRIPPLRERREDLMVLFGHFLQEAAQRYRRSAPPLSDAVRRRLMDHDWPGNVRELSHFAGQVALGFEEGPAKLAGASQAPESLPDRIDAFESQLIEETLASVRGDVREALEVLRIPRKTFYDKLRRHGISIDNFRRRGAPSVA